MLGNHSSGFGSATGTGTRSQPGIGAVAGAGAGGARLCALSMMEREGNVVVTRQNVMSLVDAGQIRIREELDLSLFARTRRYLKNIIPRTQEHHSEDPRTSFRSYTHLYAFLEIR